MLNNCDSYARYSIHLGDRESILYDIVMVDAWYSAFVKTIELYNTKIEP